MYLEIGPAAFQAALQRVAQILSTSERQQLYAYVSRLYAPMLLEADRQLREILLVSAGGRLRRVFTMLVNASRRRCRTSLRA